MHMWREETRAVVTAAKSATRRDSGSSDSGGSPPWISSTISFLFPKDSYQNTRKKKKKKKELKWKRTNPFPPPCSHHATATAAQHCTRTLSPLATDERFWLFPITSHSSTRDGGCYFGNQLETDLKRQQGQTANGQYPSWTLSQKWRRRCTGAIPPAFTPLGSLLLYCNTLTAGCTQYSTHKETYPTGGH